MLIPLPVSSHLDVGQLVAAADVVGLPDLALVKNAVEGGGHVLDVEEVSCVTAVAMESNGEATQQLVGKLGNHFLWVLVRAVDIISASDDNGQVEGPVVRLGGNHLLVTTKDAECSHSEVIASGVDDNHPLTLTKNSAPAFVAAYGFVGSRMCVSFMGSVSKSSPSP